MAHSDARKTPWYVDLSAQEMEEALALVPALLEVATAACVLSSRPGTMDGAPHDRVGLAAALGQLDRAHPAWRTWLTVEHGR
jgi:hypothetical protein